MVRTQIYLTRAEHAYLQQEAANCGEPMSAVIRNIIDEKMNIPEDAWANNSLLDPTPDVENWESPGDGSINHDHYIYGGAKKYEARGDDWELLPPLKK